MVADDLPVSDNWNFYLVADELPVSNRGLVGIVSWDFYLVADELPVSDRVGISIWLLMTCLLVTELEFLFGG